MEHHRNTDDAGRSDYSSIEIRLKTTWAVTVFVNEGSIPYLSLGVNVLDEENKYLGSWNPVARYLTTEIRSSGCQNLNRGPEYLDNLKRLGLIENLSGITITDKEVYEAIKKKRLQAAILIMENYLLFWQSDLKLARLY